MTTQFRMTARCPNCHYDIQLEDEISSWVRNNPRLNSGLGFTFMDKDLICHRYKTTHCREFQCLMFVEFKILGRQATASQHDTMFIVDQLFRNDKTTPTKRSRIHIHRGREKVWSTSSSRWVDVKLFGYHLVRMNGRSVEESSQILWDKREVSSSELESLLRFDINPDTLQPMDWRIHHRKQPENLLPLTT